jgi:hypothetical protein
MGIAHFTYSDGRLHHFKRHHALPQQVKEREVAEINAEGCKKNTAKDAQI